MERVYKCAECGKTFTPERSTARYCSPRCRDKHNYKRRQLEKKYQAAIDLIHELGHILDEQPEHSYDAAIKLSVLEKIAQMHRPGYSAWWHCSKCRTSVHKPLPDGNECQCDKPDWRLMKTLI